MLGDTDNKVEELEFKRRSLPPKSVILVLITLLSSVTE